MNVLHIKASPKQLTKLRRGHKVRISKAIEGEGFNLIVQPERFSIISRTFNKGKGAEIALTPEEIMMNKQLSPEDHQRLKEKGEAMSGKGIFGHTFDKAMRKVFGKTGKKVIYKGAKELLLEPVKSGIDAVAGYAPELATGALTGLALATAQPELVPFAVLAGQQLGSFVGRKGADVAKDYLERPSAYHQKITSNAGGTRSRIAPSTLQGQVAQNEVLANLNQELGTQYGALSQATLANLLAQLERANVANRRVGMEAQPIPSAVIPQRYLQSGIQGNGLGGGLYAGSKGRGLRGERASVGRGAGMVHHPAVLPPALVSQPFSANFQFSHTFPAQVQKFSKGSGLYL